MRGIDNKMKTKKEKKNQNIPLDAYKEVDKLKYLATLPDSNSNSKFKSNSNKTKTVLRTKKKK